MTNVKRLLGHTYRLLIVGWHGSLWEGVLFVITIELFVITVFCPYSVRILSVFCCFDRIRYSVHQKRIHRIRTKYEVFCPPEYMVRILSVFCVFCDSVEYGQIGSPGS